MKIDDNYVITIDHIITNFDRSIVTWLYQPIMGYQSAILYNTLIEECAMYNKVKLSLNLKRLLKITGLNTNLFFQAKEKLEGLGLLKTFYRRKTNTYNFKIKPPISPDNFFQDEILSNLLANKLGESDYEYTVLRFAQSEDVCEDDIDVSTSFLDAFCGELALDNTVRKPGFNIISKHKKPAIWDITLDFAEIDRILINKKINLKLYLPFKGEILKVANFYKIHTKEIAKFIMESMRKDQFGAVSFDLNYFTESIHNSYDCQLLEMYNSGEQMAMQIDENNSATNLTMLEAKIKEMYNIEPAEYLNLLKDNKGLLPEEIEILSNLIIKYHLTPGVVNCLVEYVYFKNQNRLEPNYIYKIATTLNQMQIATVEQAMEHLKGAFKNSNQKEFMKEMVQQPKPAARSRKRKPTSAHQQISALDMMEDLDSNIWEQDKTEAQTIEPITVDELNKMIQDL